jgi:hypothetical protein
MVAYITKYAKIFHQSQNLGNRHDHLDLGLNHWGSSIFCFEESPQ